MKDAKGHGSDARGDGVSHQTGVNQIGRPTLPPSPVRHQFRSVMCVSIIKRQRTISRRLSVTDLNYHKLRELRGREQSMPTNKASMERRGQSQQWNFPFPLLGGTRHLSAPTRCSIKDGLRRRISWQFTFRGMNTLVTLKATRTCLHRRFAAKMTV